MDCRNILPHSVTKKTPYEIVFGYVSNDARHIRPFGCRIEFHPPANKISTFNSRTDDGINLFHEGGGIYRIETSDGTVRTKHGNFIEHEFPGSILSMESENELSSSSESESTTGLSISSSSTWPDNNDDDDDDIYSSSEEENDSNTDSSDESNE